MASISGHTDSRDTTEIITVCFQAEEIARELVDSNTNTFIFLNRTSSIPHGRQSLENDKSCILKMWNPQDTRISQEKTSILILGSVIRFLN